MLTVRLFRLLALMSAVFALWTPMIARAQYDEEDDVEEGEEDENFDMWGQNMISRSDIEVMARTLAMSDEQRESALDLYSAFELAYKTATKKLTDVQQKLQQDGADEDPEQWKKLQPIYEKYNEHIEKLRTTLLEDLQLTLTDEQKDKWPRVEKKLKRKESMMQLVASGSRADLSVLVQRVLGKDAPSADLATLLDQYEVELDRALDGITEWQKEREKMWKEDADRYAEMSMEERMEISRKYMEEGVKKSRGVREVNLRFLPRIGEQLPEDKRFAFENDFYRQTFWGLQMYDMGMRGRGGAVDRSFAAIEKAKSKGLQLTDEKQEQVRQLRRTYENERRSVRDKRVQKILESEDNPKQDENRGFGYYNPDPEEMRKEWEQARESEKTMMEKIRALFTAEQLDKIGSPLKVGGNIDIDNINFDE